MVQLASPAPYASVDPGLEFGNTTVKPYSRIRPHGGKDHQWSLANPTKSRQTHAPAAGIVKAAYNDGKWHNGWGNHVDIHITTEAFVRLAHHETGTVRVRAGQIVALMDRIGTMGDTGEVKKNHDHLHEELWLKQKDGSWKRVDPDLYRGPKGRHLPGKALVAAPKPTTPKPAPAGHITEDEDEMTVKYTKPKNSKSVYAIYDDGTVRHVGKVEWIITKATHKVTGKKLPYTVDTVTEADIATMPKRAK